jgi:hypothetical protein
MLYLQHQYNNCTTTPHMRVGFTHWDPPSYEGLLCNYCDGVVQKSNLIYTIPIFNPQDHDSLPTMTVMTKYSNGKSLLEILYNFYIKLNV